VASLVLPPYLETKPVVGGWWLVWRGLAVRRRPSQMIGVVHGAGGVGDLTLMNKSAGVRAGYKDIRNRNEFDIRRFDGAFFVADTATAGELAKVLRC